MNYQSRLSALLRRDGCHPRDIERISLFKIIAGNLELYNSVDHFYDFEDHSIKPENIEKGTPEISSSAKALIKLGYSLYNGYPADVFKTFNVLGEDNAKLAISVIQERFISEEP